MNDFKKSAIEAALKSGRFIKRSVGKVSRIEYKGRTNIVTDVDKKSEAIIIGMLRSAYPLHAILSEESGLADTRSPYRWIVDPLDGTTNFAHAFPFFSVSIALEERGEVRLGVVYDPMRDELFCAEKGRGASLNGKPIHVSGKKRLAEGFLATGFAYGIREAKNTNLRNFGDFLMRSLAVRRPGSAALDLCYVACGRFDGFWEMGLHPWDNAAATLIVREAKGRVTKFDGSTYSHYDKEILASNRKLHSQMVFVLTRRSRLSKRKVS